jgi:hypothetical protein
MNRDKARDAGGQRGKRDRTETGERLKTLKHDIALNQYEVDAELVADAILSKLRLVRRGRVALASDEADRTRRSGRQHRRGR